MDYPHKINKVQIRNLQIEDYAQLSQSFTRVYSDGSDVFWTHEQIEKLMHHAAAMSRTRRRTSHIGVCPAASGSTHAG